MKLNIIFLGIFLIFFAIYFFGLYFSINKLYFYFNLKAILHPLIIAIIIFGLVLLSNFLQERFSNYFTQSLYNVSYLIFALALMFILVTVILEGIKYLLKINILAQTFGMIVIIITLLLFTYSLINALSYNQKEITIKTDKILENTKIVHLSDIHLFGINSKNRFENVYKKAIKDNPDYIIITGDLFDRPGNIPLDTLDITKKYNVPVIYAHGNHDLLYGEERVLDLLKNGKITFLDTNNYNDKNRNLNFIGIRYDRNEDFLKKEISKIEIKKENYNVLLYHEPIDIPIAADNNINLMLSGHTHGGQAFPITLLVKSIYKYYRGEYQYNDMIIIVSQGTNFWGPKIRLGTQNEIITINLEKI
jgi:predicted MPP superfamily phosphohydrolase